MVSWKEITNDNISLNSYLRACYIKTNEKTFDLWPSSTQWLQSRSLTLKSRRASIWFWMMGMVLSSFSVLMVLMTPSTLSDRTTTKTRGTMVFITDHRTFWTENWPKSSSTKEFSFTVSVCLRVQICSSAVRKKFPVLKWWQTFCSYPRLTLVKSKATCL